MNRRVFLILAGLVCIATAIIALLLPHNSHAPRFVPGAPAFAPPFGIEWYGWNADVPFQNDQMWLLVQGGPFGAGKLAYTNYTYLYDLRQRKVLGQLFTATPEFSSRDGSRILVEGYGPQPFSFTQSVLAPILKPFGVKLPAPPRRTETFWTLDLSNNVAKRIGSIWQYSNSGSNWHPSPDFRFGYTVPSTTTSSLFLCDLEQSSLTNIPIRGYPFGWWDDHDILMGSADNQFDLLDVGTQTTRHLFSAADFTKLLTLSGFPIDDAPLISTEANWNGRGFDFYFGLKDQIRGIQGSNSFVLKASAASPQLQLVYPDFAFKWGGHFDATGRFYVFQGESGQPGRSGDGAVYLRDLARGAVSTIVPPDHKSHYAIPRFYGNEVIYFHNHLIHRISLDGSDDVPILSPPGK